MSIIVLEEFAQVPERTGKASVSKLLICWVAVHTRAGRTHFHDIRTTRVRFNNITFIVSCFAVGANVRNGHAGRPTSSKRCRLHRELVEAADEVVRYQHSAIAQTMRYTVPHGGSAQGIQPCLRGVVAQRELTAAVSRLLTVLT